jgi:hypothetical protein
MTARPTAGTARAGLLTALCAVAGALIVAALLTPGAALAAAPKSAPTTAGATGSNPGSVAIGDVTGDGRPDLATANYNGNSVTVIARSAAGTGWDAPVTAGATGANPNAVAIGDVTGDGRPDLVTANRGANSVTVIARSAAGTGWDAPVTAGTTLAGPISVAIGDLNGDGRPDLAIANWATSSVSVIARNAAGTGWDAPVTAGTTGVSPVSVAIGDLNGDGRPDLATADFVGPSVTVIARNAAGTGWDAPVTAGTTGAGPISVAIGDLNGDGRPDLATSDADGRTVTVIARNAAGSGWDAPVNAGSAGLRPSSVAIGDLNGDGLNDLAVADNYGAAVRVLTADDTAPVTTDDVDAAWHAAPVPVTLSASDAPSGVATTYYTTGTAPATPTTASAVYSPAAKPTLGDGERISYFSVDNAGNAEAVSTSPAAKVDTVAPVTTDDVDAVRHAAAVPVTLSASDAQSGVARTYYTVGVAPAAPTTASAVYSPAAKPTLGDGERISYFSVDEAGNAEVAKTSGAAVVGVDAPSVPVTPPDTVVPPQAPKVTLGKLVAPKLATLRAKGLPVPLACLGTCKVTLSLRVTGKVAKQLGLAKTARKPVVVGTGSGSIATATRRVTVTLTRAARKALKRPRSVAATLTIAVSGGNTVTKALTFVR